ncbi:hypothetical protein BK667_09160 [Pseudomonas frederiksbergensis]|nr:hypothetical protein BK667_09160 [Pseudomonas frederiksbergensis]
MLQKQPPSLLPNRPLKRRQKPQQNLQRKNQWLPALRNQLPERRLPSQPPPSQFLQKLLLQKRLLPNRLQLKPQPLNLQQKRPQNQPQNRLLNQLPELQQRNRLPSQPRSQ